MFNPHRLPLLSGSVFTVTVSQTGRSIKSPLDQTNTATAGPDQMENTIDWTPGAGQLKPEYDTAGILPLYLLRLQFCLHENCSFDSSLTYGLAPASIGVNIVQNIRRGGPTISPQLAGFVEWNNRHSALIQTAQFPLITVMPACIAIHACISRMPLF